MKEIIILIVVAISSLFILGYSVHMFIGGLVSPATEQLAITIAIVIGVIVLTALGIDIIKQRKRR